MLGNPRISFATLSLSGGIVTIAQRRRRRPPANQDGVADRLRHPARHLTSKEIHNHICEGDDGLLWGAYDIPVYHNYPLDESNRETIDSEMSNAYESHEAVRDGDVLLVKIFDGTDDSGMPLQYDDIASLGKTEDYETMVSISNRLEQYRVLNEEDFSEKEIVYVIERLTERCKDVVKKGTGNDWPTRLFAWLDQNDSHWDQEDDYAYKTADIVRGLIDRTLPAASRGALAPADRRALV